MNRRILAVTAAAAILLMGCGSEQPSAIVTVSATVTAPTTIIQTETQTVAAGTETKTTIVWSTETEIETKDVPTTIVKTVPKTVVKTKEVPTTETVTAQPKVPEGGVGNGDFVIGQDIPPGTYKCMAPGELTNWKITSSSGEQQDFDISTIAFVPDTGYSVSFRDCNGNWAPVN